MLYFVSENVLIMIRLSMFRGVAGVMSIDFLVAKFNRMKVYNGRVRDQRVCSANLNLKNAAL